ncbi:hypothetical protein [Burkholderia sp. F1]|uniref:hypothetical protein n=1 Tax=Burkholderia sp. F1 TaxID=3366817 RepID=UPI003D70AF4B
MPNSGELLLGGILALLIGVGLAAFVVPERKEAAKAVVDQSSESVPVADAASAVSTSPAVGGARSDFGITPEQFRTAYNRLVSSGYELATLEIIHDIRLDRMTERVGPDVVLIGVIDTGNELLRDLAVNVENNASGITEKNMAVLVAVAQAADPATSAQVHVETLASMAALALEQRSPGKVIRRTAGNLDCSAYATSDGTVYFQFYPR